MSTPMQRRIYEADLMTLGFSYMAFVGMPFLSLPLPTYPFDPADWFGWIVKRVVDTPTCTRTADQAWAELAAINNPKLTNLLDRMEETR